jgi:hypothetical protein
MESSSLHLSRTRNSSTHVEDEIARVGIKRLKQNSLYRLKLKVEEESALGRDVLSEEADGIRRKIVKARKRLAHFS